MSSRCGPFYPVPGYPAGPPPAHRVEIWVGAMAPRALELIGRKADGWIPGGGASRIDEFAGLAARIEDAAVAAGQILAPSGASSTCRAASRTVRLATSLDGPVDLWIDKLTRWAVELRIDAFIVLPPDAGTGIIEHLATEVVPAVHEATKSGAEMGKLIYLLNVSLDGFIETPDHSLAWASVDENSTRFNDHMRELAEPVRAAPVRGHVGLLAELRVRS